MTRDKTDAEFMDGATMGIRAWNWDHFPTIKARIVSTRKNQHGTVYTFADKSRGFVVKGSARLRARGAKP